MKGQFKLKPGTVVLLFFIAIFGYASYTLVMGNLHEIGTSTSNERESVMRCSELEIEFVDVNELDEQVQIFFRTNDDLPGVKIGFEGSNTTRLVEDVKSNTLYNTSINVSDYSNIYIETDRCKDAYWWR